MVSITLVQEKMKTIDNTQIFLVDEDARVLIVFDLSWHRQIDFWYDPDIV